MVAISYSVSGYAKMNMDVGIAVILRLKYVSEFLLTLDF